jgi:hypothetical protein
MRSLCYKVTAANRVTRAMLVTSVWGVQGVCLKSIAVVLASEADVPSVDVYACRALGAGKCRRMRSAEAS